MHKRAVVSLVLGFILVAPLAVMALAGAGRMSFAFAQGGTPSASPGTGTPAASPVGSPVAGTPVAGGGSVIDVTASAYKFTPNTFDLKVGQPITFVVTSTDIYHTFTVKQSKDATDTLFSLDVQPGQTAQYTFTPKQPGDLFLYCIPHLALGMTGSIHVSA